MPNLSCLRKMVWIGLSILSVACTKSSNGPNENNNTDKPVNAAAATQKFAVHFAVGDVTVLDARVAAKEMPIRNYLHYFFYAAYDSTGRQVSKIVQQPLDTDYIGPEFGVVKDSLAPGNYTIVVIGERHNFIEIQDDSLLSTINLVGSKYNGSMDYVFIKKYPIQVLHADITIHAIKLEPVTGQLEINLTDSNHLDILKGTILIDSVPSLYMLSTEKAGLFITANLDNYFNLYAPWTVDYGILGSNASHNITITMYDNDGNLVKQRTITDVYVYAGRKTILRGKFLDTQNGRSRLKASRTIDPLTGEIIQNF